MSLNWFLPTDSSPLTFCPIGQVLAPSMDADGNLAALVFPDGAFPLQISSALRMPRRPLLL